LDRKNHKNIGERGERIAIGELAKYDIDVLLPMSDNLPFDFVAFSNGKFYKCQVKTTNSVTKNNSLLFNLKSNNWNKKTEHKYTNDEVDVFILCDFINVYLVKFEELNGKSVFLLRKEKTKNNQTKGINLAENYLISSERITEVFN